jgi:hypothetical protein
VQLYCQVYCQSGRVYCYWQVSPPAVLRAQLGTSEQSVAGACIAMPVGLGIVGHGIRLHHQLCHSPELAKGWGYATQCEAI